MKGFDFLNFFFILRVGAKLFDCSELSQFSVQPIFSNALQCSPSPIFVCIADLLKKCEQSVSGIDTSSTVLVLVGIKDWGIHTSGEPVG